MTLQKDYLYLIRMTESTQQKAGYQVMELLVENAISLILFKIKLPDDTLHIKTY
jgi:hypothetical protein